MRFSGFSVVKVISVLVLYGGLIGSGIWIYTFHVTCPLGEMHVAWECFEGSANFTLGAAALLLMIYWLLVEFFYPKTFCSICPLGNAVRCCRVEFKGWREKLYFSFRRVFSLIGWIALVFFVVFSYKLYCQYMCPLNALYTIGLMIGLEAFDLSVFLKVVGILLSLVILKFIFSYRALCINGMCPVEKIWRMIWWFRNFMCSKGGVRCGEKY